MCCNIYEKTTKTLIFFDNIPVLIFFKIQVNYNHGKQRC